MKHPPTGGGGAGNEPLERPHPRVGCTDSSLRTSPTREERVLPAYGPPREGVAPTHPLRTRLARGRGGSTEREGNMVKHPCPEGQGAESELLKKMLGSGPPPLQEESHYGETPPPPGGAGVRGMNP
jgi:hypothetical protein